MTDNLMMASCRVELTATPPGSEATGAFVALVLTFDVVDANNRIVRRGAFAESITAWRNSGDKVPVIWSHGYDTPESIIGAVDPVAGLEETAQGLVARGHLDLHDPAAAKVHKLLANRVLREWSFAALIVKAKTLANGVREVLAADLIELGPTLKGAGRTATLMVAARRAPPESPQTARERRRVAVAALDRQISVYLAATGAVFTTVTPTEDPHGNSH